MINVVNKSTDPYFNLALEEYFVKYKDLNDDILILWQNKSTIVIGKNQNTYAEVNLDYVEDHGINVVRRMSGGGTVYHDLGNLNYTIIKNGGYSFKNDFSFFALPVISCLKKYGISAIFNGRNDILIDGKKFSGNAQYFYKNKMLHHGTLLYSSDLTFLSKALQVKKEKYESKGIKSVNDRVTNISDHMDEKIALSDFRKSLTISMFDENEKNIKNYELSNVDISEVLKLRDSKYSTWEWNYGYSPKASYKKEIRFPAGIVSLFMNIENGKIHNCKLFGDFFEVKPIEELEKQFKGKRYDKSEIEFILSNINISDYIHLINNKEFKQLFF